MSGKFMSKILFFFSIKTYDDNNNNNNNNNNNTPFGGLQHRTEVGANSHNIAYDSL